jgi:hypothetical protein
MLLALETLLSLIYSYITVRIISFHISTLLTTLFRRVHSSSVQPKTGLSKPGLLRQPGGHNPKHLILGLYEHCGLKMANTMPENGGGTFCLILSSELILPISVWASLRPCQMSLRAFSKVLKFPSLRRPPPRTNVVNFRPSSLSKSLKCTQRRDVLQCCAKEGLCSCCMLGQRRRMLFC